MKRKIFSKLLMVALVIAAVGSFVSCKDYDDDINNLQKQIDAKAAISELTALQSTLEGKISTATAAAQKAAEDAAAKADASLKSTLEAAIADAKKAGTDAGTEAGKAIAAANAAQTTADAAAAAAKKADEDAKAALEAALKTIEETYETKAEAAAAATEAAKALADVKAIADAAFTKAEAEELKAELDGLKESLESSIDEKIAAAIAELDNASASVKAIWSAVTGIDIFGTVTGDKLNDGAPYLAFLHGQIKLNSLFGNNEDISGQEGAPFKSFSDKDSIRVANVLVVKVNPVNATFKAEDLKLIDSEGNDLNGYVEFGEPVKFEGLLTRAGETGLWAIPVSMSDDKTEAEFNAQTIKKFDAKKDKVIPVAGRQKLYAVALNNTAADAEGRFVASTFDVTAYSAPYKAATDLWFTVNDKGIDELKNRWTVNGEVVAEDGAKSTKNPEYVWMTDEATKKKNKITDLTPDTAVNKAVVEATADGYDARYDFDKYEFVDVEVGETFTIEMAEQKKIEWFYVVFDQANAIESSPSELRAWQSYAAKIDGLGVMTHATETLEMAINDPKANYDIIGFRVYGVNYDGTLADPDGRAFYVRVGGAKAANSATIADEADVEWTAINATTANKNVSAVYALDLGDNEFETLTSQLNGTIELDPDDYKNIIFADAADNTPSFQYQLYQDAAAKKAATNWNNAAYIKVTAVSHPGLWLDGASIAYTIKGIDADSKQVVNSISLNIKKVMPDNDKTGLTWKAGADKDGQTLKLHMTPDNTVTVAQILAANTTLPAAVPAADWTTKATYGVKKLSDVLTLDEEYDWNIVIAGAKTDKKDPTTAYVAGTGAGANNFVNSDYKIPQAAGTATAALAPIAIIANDLEINTTKNPWEYQTARWAGKVGNGTAYAMTINRSYADISCVYNAETEVFDIEEDYNAEVDKVNTYFVDDIKENQTWRALSYQYVSEVKDGKNVWSTTGINLKYGATTLTIETGVAGAIAGGADEKKVKTGDATATEAFLLEADAKALGKALPLETADCIFNFATGITTFVVGKNSWLDNGYETYFAANKYLKALTTPAGQIYEINGVRQQAVTTFNVRMRDAEDYYTAAMDDAGVITLTKKADAPATIAKDINCTMVVTALTAYGNSVTVVEIPVTLKK